MTFERADAGLPNVRQARDLVAGLRALAVADPSPEIAPGVLAKLGLADEFFTVESPLGTVYVAHNQTGISAVGHAVDAADFASEHRSRTGRPTFPARQPPAKLANDLACTLRGEENARRLSFDLRGLTEFERAVLLKALEIPRGEVRPYAWVAREIGHPGAVRAVGTALAHNPIPLLIPCHRVVRSDGTLGRYSLIGDDAKRVVLAAEGLDAARLEALARQGTRFVGTDSTHIYCFPTCRHARRVMPRHLVQFSSADEAARAGYRPCKVCRPLREA